MACSGRGNFDLHAKREAGEWGKGVGVGVGVGAGGGGEYPFCEGLMIDWGRGIFAVIVCGVGNRCGVSGLRGSDG